MLGNTRFISCAELDISHSFSALTPNKFGVSMHTCIILYDILSPNNAASGSSAVNIVKVVKDHMFLSGRLNIS